MQLNTEKAISLRPGEGTEWEGCAKVYFYSNFVLAFMLFSALLVIPMVGGLV